MASVTDDRVMLEGREVWISRPADSEALLTDEAFEREEFLPYWADLWPSAIELAHVVARWDLAGRRVLELGCGLALPGIAAALRGARVTVSDWAPDALGFARSNAERNGVALEVVEVSWAEPRAVLEGAPWSGKGSVPWTPRSVHDFMHAKVVVADDTSFVGSFNLSRSGERNAENVVEIRDEGVSDRLAAYIDGVRARYPRASPPGSEGPGGARPAPDRPS